MCSIGCVYVIQVKCVLEAFDEYLGATYNQQLPIPDKKDFLTKLLTFSNMTETKSNYADTVGFFVDNECTGPTCVKHPTQDVSVDLKFIAIVANATFSNPQVRQAEQHASDTVYDDNTCPSCL